MSRLGEISAEKGADTDPRLLEAYQMQCVAEAQEGKIIPEKQVNNSNIIWCVYDKDHMSALQLKNTSESDPHSYEVT